MSGGAGYLRRWDAAKTVRSQARPESGALSSSIVETCTQRHHATHDFERWLDMSCAILDRPRAIIRDLAPFTHGDGAVLVPCH